MCVDKKLRRSELWGKKSWKRTLGLSVVFADFSSSRLCVCVKACKDEGRGGEEVQVMCII